VVGVEMEMVLGWVRGMGRVVEEQGMPQSRMCIRREGRRWRVWEVREVTVVGEVGTRQGKEVQGWGRLQLGWEVVAWVREMGKGKGDVGMEEVKVREGEVKVVVRGMVGVVKVVGVRGMVGGG
jgi:hypothetical protein